MSAGIGTMKLARIIHQKKRRPGNSSCEIAYPAPAAMITTMTVTAAEVMRELRYQIPILVWSST